ncbi:MAG: carboxypeptidase regulatory-like domain-containing protein [Candidatus Aminicenantales bacterium]
MFKKILFLAAIFSLSSLGIAQTLQTGNLMGTVRSTDGKGLPGVSVTITSPAMIIPSLTAITNESGAYRFLALPPGEYEMTFEMPGMNTLVRKGVRTDVVQTVTINVTMEMKSVPEPIVIVGQTPMLDKHRVTHPTTMDKEFFKSVPNSGAGMVPGVTGDTAHGSSIMDNSWNLDGVNVIDLATGVPNVNFGLDIVEELSVQTGGLAAEFGSVRGAVINVVTKSGGDNFSGSANFYFNHESLKSDNTKGTPLEGTKSGNKYEIEPVVTLGGPLIRNKLWFFTNGGFSQREYFVAGYPAGSAAGKEKSIKTVLYYPFVKLSFQPGPKDKFILSYNFCDHTNSDRVASRFSTESVTLKQISPTHTLSAQWTKFFGNDFYTNLRFGVVLFKMNLDAKGNEAQYYDYMTGISSGNAWRNQDHYTRNRFQFNADATALIDNFMGTHELKFGAEAQLAYTTWMIYCVSDPVTGGCYNHNFGSSYYMTWIQVNQGFDRKDNVVDYHGFVQDNWEIAPNLNLSLGLRLEYNSVVYPKQNTEEGPIVFQGKTYNRGISESKTMYGWLNLAPRVGLIYDIFSDGKTLFKASFSRYILPNQVGWINLAHPNGWFGYFQFLNADGTAIPGATIPWATPGGYANGGAQIGYKDYKLKAGYTDEVTVGVERELLEDWSIGLRYIKKWDRNQPYLVDAAQLDIDKLMSTGELDWSKNWYEVTTIDRYNGQTVTFWARKDLMAQELYIVNPPGADRDYDGVEFTLNKRYSKGWAINLSYVHANSRGLITTARTEESLGGGGSGGFFQNPNAHINAFGQLPLERRHQFKLEGLVKGPWGVNLGGYFRYTSGTTYTRLITSNLLGVSLPQGSTTIYAERRGSQRLPDFCLLDLRLEKIVKIRMVFVRVFMDCLNVFNSGIAVDAWANSSSTSFYRYKQMTAINDPRIFQLGARIEF